MESKTKRLQFAQKGIIGLHRFNWQQQSFIVACCLFATLSLANAFVPVTPTTYVTKQLSKASPLFVAKSGGRMIETVEEFAEIVLSEETPRPVLVFFSAAWCGPCRLSIPVIKDIMKQFSGQIDVVEICTDDLAETSAECGVVSIPTIQFYYKGELLDTIVGCVAKNVLASAVTKVLDDISTMNKPGDSTSSYEEEEA